MQVEVVGTVCFHPLIFLQNFLFVPAFNFNLLSVSRLIDHKEIGLFFMGAYCIIPDLSAWRMIGKAKQENGLFILEVPLSSTCHSVSSVSFDIWHYRLDHPSDDSLLCLKSQLLFWSNKSTCFCPACYRAKPRRLPFPDHVANNNAIFDLIHMDVWGPYSQADINRNHYFLTIVDDAS